MSYEARGYGDTCAQPTHSNWLSYPNLYHVAVRTYDLGLYASFQFRVNRYVKVFEFSGDMHTQLLVGRELSCIVAGNEIVRAKHHSAGWLKLNEGSVPY